MFRLIAAFTAFLALAPQVYCGQSDLLPFAERLTKELYLQPLHIDAAALQIEVDRYDLGHEPHGVVVHVFESSEPNAAEILTVNVVRVHGYLQYVSAAGSSLTKAANATPAERSSRRETAVRVLGELGGYQTDGKEHRSHRPGFVEMRFTHSKRPAYLLSGTSTAVFEEGSGLLKMFGTPAVPPGE